MLLTSGPGPEYPEIQHMFDVPIEVRRRRHGSGSMDLIRSVSVAELVTVRFHFDIGEAEIETGGKLAVAWRWPFDWADLQSEHPDKNGYVGQTFLSAAADRNVCPTFDVRYHRYSGVEPWHHYLCAEVTDSRLMFGDRVQITCSGWRAPTCAESRAGFLMLIDPSGNGKWIRLIDPPCFPILGGAAHRLVVVASSDAVVDEPTDVLVRAEDVWGNPVGLNDVPRLRTDSRFRLGDARVLDDPSACWIPVTFEEPGLVTLQATVAGLAATSNPIRIHRAAPAQRVFWGDFHSGQSLIGCGRGTLADHYRFGRDAAGLQFITHQANDHYVTGEDWQHTRQVTESFHAAGRYVPMLGCEWSAPTADGGDRNVAYRHDESRLRRSGRFFSESEADAEPDIPRAPEFLAAMKDEAVLINMHVGGRPTNLDWHEPRIERLAEIHSTHGTVEWFIFDALSRGYKIGITAGTDGVSGRPGACSPGWRLIRNLPSGVTAVIAESLTRESVWQALHERRCYATTGPRILLDVQVDGRPMGSEFDSNAQPLIAVSVIGTAAIERIDLLRGTQVIATWNLATPQEEWHRILWSGTHKKGTARAQTVVWDGNFSVVDGEIGEIRPVGYYSAADVLCQMDPRTIAWRSATAGNDAGFLFRVDGGAETRGRFWSAPCCFEFPLQQVLHTPLMVEAGGVNRHVTASTAPDERGSRQAEVTFRDCAPVAGCNAYWVRVIQVDRARAWSSPVYVHQHSL